MIITSDITKAVQVLRSSGIVAFPTETVYGLGGDAMNEIAINKIFAAKERPPHHPLIVHLATIEQIYEWVQDVSQDALALAQAFWPGPLTMIFKKRPRVSDAVTGGQDTIGLRIPNHPVAQALLQAYGQGIAGPSANKFTHISPTTAEAVLEELGSKVNLVLEGGQCEVGVESTIVDMSGDGPVLMRPGMINRESIEQILGAPMAASRFSNQRAPGMHVVHYAPATPTELIEAKNIPGFIDSLRANDFPIAFLAYSDAFSKMSSQIDWIGMPNNAHQYAHVLYHKLRLLDRHQYKKIMVEAVPDGGDWEAIKDRLSKASGRR